MVDFTKGGECILSEGVPYLQANNTSHKFTTLALNIEHEVLTQTLALLESTRLRQTNCPHFLERDII